MNKGKIKEKYRNIIFSFTCRKCRKKTDHKFKDCQKKRFIVLQCRECGHLISKKDRELEEQIQEGKK